MTDHPKFRVHCRCGRPYCPYRSRHRKDFTMADRYSRSINPLGIVLAIAMWSLVILHAKGSIPWWVFWSAFALYCARLFWLYGPRPAAWRVTDDRRPSWAKKDDNH